MKRAVKALVALFAVSAISMGSYALPEGGSPNGIMCITAEAKARLRAPQNIKTKVTSTTVTISWDEVSGADAYRVYMYDESQKRYAVYKNVSGTACQVTDLGKNKTYYFKVAALVKNKEKYTEQERSGQITVKTKVSLPASPSADYTGFASANNKKYYFEQGNICLGFKKIGNDYYYFTDDGSMLTGWLNYYGRYYYLYTDGKMVAGKSLKFTDGNTYTFAGNGILEWDSNMEEPVAAYEIMGDKPNIYLEMSSKTKYTSVITIGIENKGSKSVKIYKAGELIDSTTSSFDRTLGLAFRDDDELSDFRDMTIIPGDSAYLGWICVPDDTWYDKKTIIKFYFKYDNVCYRAICSDYYGSYYEVIHFDPDNM